MKHVSVLIKPASAHCDLRCRYCFYADVSARRAIPSHGVMTDEAMKAVIRSLFAGLDDGDHLAVAFQGGEPTLAGLGFFEAFTDHVSAQRKQASISWSIQTNGMHLNEAWAAFFRKHDFLVGLSMDGGPRSHDANRIDAAGDGTWKKVSQAKKLLDDWGVPVNILTVLTAEMASRPDEVMDDLIAQGVGYVQFIPCLADLDGGDWAGQALTPQAFAAFYGRIFSRWIEELRRGRAIHIQFIDAVLELLASGQATLCGLNGSCRLQNVIEADGSVYPCDFYVLDNWWMGNLAVTDLEQLKSAPPAAGFLAEEQTMAELCRRCRYAGICRGGCKRMKHTMYLDPDGAFCGYQAFLDQHYASLRLIARQLQG